MRRIYETVAVAEEDDGYSIMLDGRPLRSPGRRIVALRYRDLVEAVAAEWRAQGETVDPSTMPMMSLSVTAIDRVAPCREEVIDTITAYAASDLLCYRAEQPRDLVMLQEQCWQPLLDWCSDTFGAPLRVTTGVMPTGQPQSTVAALRRAVSRKDDLTMTGLHELTIGSGSLVVGLAISEGRISVDEGLEVAMLDEAYQIERWGEDAEARQRRENICREMRAAARFLQYARVLN